MKRLMRRSISLALTLFMALAMIPASAAQIRSSAQRNGYNVAWAPPVTYTIHVKGGVYGDVDYSVDQGGSATITTQRADGISQNGLIYKEIATDVLVDGVSVGPVSEYTFENVTADHTLEVISYRGIRVQTNAPGGTIAPGGYLWIEEGTDATFTITPDEGNWLFDVVVDDISAGAVTTYTLSNVRENHNIVAHFEKKTHTITTLAGAHGSISPSGATEVKDGELCEFYFTPDSGYQIADVLVDGVSVGPVSTYLFKSIKSDHSIEVRFAEGRQYMITASAGKGGSITPSGQLLMGAGGRKTFVIAPNVGYVIHDVLVDGVSAGAIDNYPFENIDANHTIEAVFRDSSAYTIEAGAGEGGRISSAGRISVKHGDLERFSISADYGYTVADVLVDGVSVGPVDSYTFDNVTANHTIKASFKVASGFYSITAKAGTGGTISEAGRVVVPKGGQQSFSIQANDQYMISDVLVDGLSVGLKGRYTFLNVDADHTFEVLFSLSRAFIIEAAANEGGTISPSGRTSVGQGQFKEYRIYPNADHVLTDVLVDGVSVGAVNQYSFSNINADHTIKAIFTPKQVHTIIAKANKGGTISPAGTLTVNEGESRTLYIRADSFNRISDVLVDGASLGPVSSYTFDRVSQSHTIEAVFTYAYSDKFLFGQDTFGFTNSYGYFTGKYDIPDDYLDILTYGMSNSEKYNIINFKESNWWGSCYGMSAVAALTKEGLLDPEYFQPGSACLNDLSMPRESEAVLGLINYYHLAQGASWTGSDSVWGADEIIAAMSGSDNPRILSYDSPNYAHAVVAYDVDKRNSGYVISIYDPNNNSAPGEIIVSGDYSRVTYGGEKLTLRSATRVDGKFNGRNLQEALKSGGLSLTENQDATDRIYLTTNYNSFTVSCYDSSRALLSAATVSGGKASSGSTLAVTSYGPRNEIGKELSALFSVPLLTAGQSYEIKPSDSEKSVVTGKGLETYSTSIMRNDTTNGFVSTVTAAGAGTVTIDSEGMVTTKYGAPMRQSISATRNNSYHDWHTVTIDGTDTGFTVKFDNRDVTVHSDNNVQVDATIKNDFSSAVFTNITADQVSETLKKATIPCSVIFYTQGGTSVKTISVTPGDAITAPTAPARKGYRFDGWYREPECRQAWSFASDKVYTDIKLYAKWVETVPAITINGSPGPISEPGSTSAALTLSAADLAKYMAGRDTLDVYFKDLYAIQLTLNISNLKGAPLIVRTDFGTLELPTATLKNIKDGYGDAITLSINDNGFTASLAVGGKAVNYNDEKHPLSIKIPVSLAENPEQNAYVMTRKSGAGEIALPLSACSGSFINVASATFGTFYAKYNCKQFSDLADQWAKADIGFVTSHELFSGTGGGKFSPDMTMSRAMLATVLARLGGVDLSVYKTSGFTDVPGGTWYSGAVAWASESGIISGVGGNRFNPDAPATREEIAVMLSRYLSYKGIKLKETAGSAVFSDQDEISNWALSAAAEMQRAGVISGRADNQFAPKLQASRAEVATIFARVIRAIAAG